MRRNPNTVSGLWLFLLSASARRNGVLAIGFRRRSNLPSLQRCDGSSRSSRVS
jgi:hypothetical protein